MLRYFALIFAVALAVLAGCCAVATVSTMRMP